jgi:uncharacterized membrane protein YdjX (TVP38/TMEM64 family)
LESDHEGLMHWLLYKHEAGEEREGMNQSSAPPLPVLLRYLPLIAVALAAAVFFALGLHRKISLETLIDNETALRAFIARNWLLSLVGFAALYAGLVALSLPIGAVLTITGGYLFGLAAGATGVVLGATAGACIIFFIARSSLGEGLSRRFGPSLQRFAEGFRQDAASYLLFLRLAPIFPFALVNIAPALLGARFSTFLWTTAVGIIPGTFAFSSIGSGLGSVIKAQIEAFRGCKAAGGANCTLSVDPSTLVTREVILAFALLGGVALLPIVIRRIRTARGA